MAKYRNQLPQLDAPLFLTDGGLETTLIFQDGLDLPYFAAFALLKDEAGTEALRRYFDGYASLAASRDVGIVLETATWRASSDWGQRLGYSDEEMADFNRKSVELLMDVRKKHETARAPIVISGCVGPRGDGYDPGTLMTAEEAEAYHAAQVGTFAGTGADLITGITMTNIPEAIGLANAAKAAGIPSVISFTLETDGRLPTGDSLGDAITAVDAATGNAPAYYMVNCAHPTHFASVLAVGAPWLGRLRGARANASRMSHAELDEAPELDAGDPVEFGQLNADLRDRGITVLGGCCGTDDRHIEQIYAACSR